MDDQLLREFLVEAEERIEALFTDIESLRRVLTSDGAARRELTARIFRHVHTLKGSAASLPELAAVNQLAHEFETLLDAVRRGRVKLEEATLDTCEDAVNALSLALDVAARGDTLQAPEAILKQLRQCVETLQLPVNSEADETLRVIAALPEEIARALSASERHRLAESAAEGARVMLIAVSFNLATLDKHFSRFTVMLGEGGEIISTFPGGLASAPDQINFQILYTTASEEIENRLLPFGAKIIRVEGETSLREADTGALLTETLDGAGVEELTGQPDAPTLTDAAPASAVVRVSLRELDELVVATYDLFTDTLATLEQALTFEHGGDAEATLRESAARLRDDFGVLEERVLALRMQPLLPVLERTARAARIAARVAGKEVEVKLRGGEVRLDRSLAERIGEPLLHLLRNAIDHGIETTGERRATGKSERGTVLLEVTAEGSRVRVRVSDDGRGVDPERVARAAVAQGLLEAGTRIGEEQALRLIFRPGFSTAGEVSALSGRGVGLDVVEHALESVGGEIRVRSRRGVGTTFDLRLPLALSLVSVLMLRTGGGVYAVDASQIIETGYLDAADIIDDGTKRAARWRGRTLPVISLSALLGQAMPHTFGTSDPLAIVIAPQQDGAGEWRSTESPEQFAIAVDQIGDTRDALVRSLGRHATRWRGVSGAIEQRDGTIALLLDLPRLFTSLNP